MNLDKLSSAFIDNSSTKTGNNKPKNTAFKTRDLICIGCPAGCMLHVEWEDSGITHISGNSCRIGAEYAGKEVRNPTRIVTSTVKVLKGTDPVVSVKTSIDIAKDKINDCMAAIKSCRVTAPIRIGDIVLTNAAGTGADIVATRNVDCIRNVCIY